MTFLRLSLVICIVMIISLSWELHRERAADLAAIEEVNRQTAETNRAARELADEAHALQNSLEACAKGCGEESTAISCAAACQPLAKTFGPDHTANGAAHQSDADTVLRVKCCVITLHSDSNACFDGAGKRLPCAGDVHCDGCPNTGR